MTYLDFFAINVQGTDTKIYPNGVLLPLHENTRLKALNDAGLSHVWVPNQDDFEQKVKRVINLRRSRLHGVGKNTYTKKNTLRANVRSRTSCVLVSKNWFFPSCVNKNSSLFTETAADPCQEKRANRVSTSCGVACDLGLSTAAIYSTQSYFNILV